MKPTENTILKINNINNMYTNNTVVLVVVVVELVILVVALADDLEARPFTLAFLSLL